MARGRNGGNAGQGSKWIRRSTRLRIYARDGWRCVWCGAQVFAPQAACGSELHATLDHVIPRSCGGTNVVSNLITSCMGCNRQRGELGVTSFAAARARFCADFGAVVIRHLEAVIRAVCAPLPPAP